MDQVRLFALGGLDEDGKTCMWLKSANPFLSLKRA